MIHTVKGFRIVNEEAADVFLEFPCFLYDPVNVGNLISGSSAFSKHSLCIWKFSVHLLLKPSLKDFEDNLTTATAKSLQLCPTLCDPIPGILQARTLEWVAISFSNA